VSPKGHDRPIVVGIGASAGGLEALKAFFGAMPTKTGLAFVVVMHLDPTHDSLLAGLLSHSTTLAVEQATDHQPLEPDHVYVIPPNRTLTIEPGILRVTKVADARSLRSSIDQFFRSLAEVERDRAVAIVLSGIGTEGMLGARAVKAEGGIVLAQTPDTASQPGMPASVIATGLVDVVLAPDTMPDALLACVRHMSAGGGSPAGKASAPREGLGEILDLLRSHTGNDFSGYRKGMLERRIERRMRLQHIERVSRYLAVLRSDSAEADRLFRDLLIGVTSFFRDRPAFDELTSKVLAPLVQNQDPNIPIRVWVPGCSTGEEAYSIAIILAEQIAAARSACRVQIFATDVDTTALERARAGAYPESIALDVNPRRRDRFFTREGHQYTIAKSIRESVYFAVHNLTSDPPFSKIDLVSCRNVLIYLEPPTQEKLLSLFHFALNLSGYLFLGSADGVGASSQLFAPISKRRRIFQRVGQIHHRPATLAVSLPVGTHATRPRMDVAVEPTLSTVADEFLLERLAPAALVVRSSGHIVRFYGAMERYITLPKREANLNALSLARAALRPTLRAALHGAVRRNRETALETAHIGRGRARRTLRVTVSPIPARSTPDALWLILFEEKPLAERPTRRKTGRSQSDLVRRLEAELRSTKNEQQQLIQDLESINDELTAANEEVVSTNEELQSTNEELRSSKEELQSLNEELSTLNAQLQDKVHELTAVNDDIANLLVSTDIATIFLDTELRIKRFTTAASEVFNLEKSDAGRPLRHFASQLVDMHLSRDARTVLRTGIPLEKHVSDQGGKEYVLRTLPYRSEGKAVQGVVLTLVDVTALKQSERHLRTARDQVAEDLRRMTRLHGLSADSISSSDVHAVLQNVVRAAVDITAAEMGDLQRCDESGVLKMVGHSGFKPPFLDFFASVGAGAHSPCSAAAATGRRVLVEDVNASDIFVGHPSLAVMEQAGVRAVQSTPLFDRSGRLIGVFSTHYRAVHRFDEAELRWLDLLAHHAAGLLERQRIEEQLGRSHKELESRVADRTRWLSLMHDVARAINEAGTWDDALHRVLRRLCETEHWQIGFVYVPQPGRPETIIPVVSCFGDPRFKPFHELSMAQVYSRGDRLPGSVYAEKRTFSADDVDALVAAFPVRGALARAAGLCAAVDLPVVVQGEVLAVLELFSDQAHPPDDQLTVLMQNVGDQIGRILERERSTARMADLVWREQQELLHTLHDSLGQTLTGLGMLSTGLRQRLAASDPDTAAQAAQIATQSKRALDDVRLLSKSLFPIEVDAESLVASLRDLAKATAALHKIEVRVEGDVPTDLRDGKVATELYRIAQEAVTNSVKHAQANAITIRIAGATGMTQLRVADDGVGIPSPEPNGGAGLRIMRYRAASIGASLAVERQSTGGTVVICTVREAPGTGDVA
jgi:two-component system CheB/CheR fusion protein